MTRCEHSLARFIQLGNPRTDDLPSSRSVTTFPSDSFVEILNMVLLGT